MIEPLSRTQIGENVFASINRLEQIVIETDDEDKFVIIDTETFIGLIEFARRAWPITPRCVLCGRIKINDTHHL